MQEGRWITRPCDWGRVERLASALGVGETTATVLVRRGLDDPDAARAFLAAELPPHARPDLLRALSDFINDAPETRGRHRVRKLLRSFWL